MFSNISNRNICETISRQRLLNDFSNELGEPERFFGRTWSRKEHEEPDLWRLDEDGNYPEPAEVF